MDRPRIVGLDGRPLSSIAPEFAEPVELKPMDRRQFPPIPRDVFDNFMRWLTTHQEFHHSTITVVQEENPQLFTIVEVFQGAVVHYASNNRLSIRMIQDILVQVMAATYSVLSLTPSPVGPPAAGREAPAAPEPTT